VVGPLGILDDEIAAFAGRRWLDESPETERVVAFSN
jgi:hypothetical protein